MGKRTSLLIALCLPACSDAPSMQMPDSSIHSTVEPRRITTLAGGLAGDGGSLARASIDTPLWLAIDPGGNLCFSDAIYDVVRCIDARTQVVSTIAGNGLRGSDGDGGPATEATLATPYGITFDRDGNLYICTWDDQLIRFVNRSRRTVTIATVTVAPGNIATIAGGAEWLGQTGDGGPALDAVISNPANIVVDSASPPNVYFTDVDLVSVRRIDGTTGILTRFVGSGDCYDAGDRPDCLGAKGDGGPANVASLNFPWGLAFDAAGNLYVGEVGSIRRVDAKTGIITTLAGDGLWGYDGDGGPAIAAHITAADGIRFDSAQNLLFLDIANNVVRRIRATGAGLTPESIITTVAGTGSGEGSVEPAGGHPPTAVDLEEPTGIAIASDGRVFTAEAWLGLIRVIDPGHDRILNGAAGETMIDVGSRAGLKRPGGMAVDTAGNKYVFDRFRRIQKVDTAGAISTLVEGLHGSGEPRLAADGTLYFLDIFSEEHTALRRMAPTPGAPIETVADLPFWARHHTLGRLYDYAVEEDGSRVWRVSLSDGSLTLLAGTRTPDDAERCEPTTTAERGDGGPAISATLRFPGGVALDPAETRLFIADSGSRAVRMVDLASGRISTLVELNEPECTRPGSLALDGDRYLYVGVGSGEGDGWKIMQVDLRAVRPQAYIVAGTAYGWPKTGPTGDGIATEVRLEGDLMLQVGSVGEVYFVELLHQRIRRLDAGPPAGPVGGVAPRGPGPP